MSRVELASIHALTFYKDTVTKARRTSPLPQLICQGAPCKLYTPDVVRCVNLGGSGTDVDWKCEADLPEALRFGRVEVSCEGWSKPGDPYVLKGSCSLEYRLVHVPGTLRNDNSPLRSLQSFDWSAMIFWILWIGFAIFVLYHFISSFLWGNARRPARQLRPSSNSGSAGGWFPGGMGDNRPPPPPYTKDPPESANQGWRPGFWTGAALGGLANHFWNNQRQADPRPRPAAWDWERPRTSTFTERRVYYDPDDRGEGSSNLGAMRRSTGFGGSNVR